MRTGRPKKYSSGDVAELSLSTGLSPVTIRIYFKSEKAPLFKNCFLLWYAVRRKRKMEFYNSLRKPGTQAERDLARKKIKRDTDDCYKAKIYAKNKIRRETPEGRAARNAFVRRWKKLKYDSDPLFRLAASTRARLHKVLHRSSIKKCFKTNELISCSAEQLKQWLESQFVSGMTWENYGTHWHVDHKLPLASFDLIDRTQLFTACHYTNLQPLTAFDNMSKGAKLIYVKKAA